ncbi:MAG: 4Fe-4S binding protein [Candidatus Coatesbacteria bacterium]|nr:4Fe-4S binding protein [Candidatus Coatesbacteria bacterium]
MYNNRKTQLIRRIFQFLSSLLVNSHFEGLLNNRAIYDGDLKQYCVPVLNCYACPLARFSCPIGSLQVLLSARTIPFYVVGTMLFLGIIAGRFFCGWCCPFGLLQDFLAKARKKKMQIPVLLTYVKYLVLILLIFLLPILLSLIIGPDGNYSYFCKFCPWGGLEAGLPLLIWNPSQGNARLIDYKSLDNLFYLKLSSVAAGIILSMIFYRFFCNAICPLGALLGLLNPISIMRLQVSENCNKCNGKTLCVNVCPFKIKVYENPNHPDCIRCLRCTSICNNITLKVGPYELKGINRNKSSKAKGTA